MIVAVGLAVAYALRADPRRIALLAGAVYQPWAVAAVVVWIVWRARPVEDQGASLFCEGVAAELRAGTSLRDALLAASASVGRPDFSGRVHTAPIAVLATEVGALFPAMADELRLTIVAASRSGSQAADLFDEIGSLAITQSEVKREVRIATAPGRATALLLVGAPTAYLLSRVSSGGLDRMLESGQQRAAVLAGLALFALGGIGAVAVVWSASR